MEIGPTTNGDEEGISGAQWQQAPMDGWYQITMNDKADSLGSSGSTALTGTDCLWVTVQAHKWMAASSSSMPRYIVCVG